MQVRVEHVDGELTLPLRQKVLRPHQRLADVVVPGEHDPRSVHLAAVTPHGEVVASAILIPERFALMPERADGWRLRGMATDERLRGRGVGGRVLRDAVRYVALHGGGLLWCHARLPALQFYQRAGFAAIGDAWVDPYTGPHVAMWREVEPSPDCEVEPSPD